MKEVINFLITFSLFIIAIQFYVVEPKATIAQIDENASEEFFNRGNEEIEQEARYLENQNTSQDNINREIRQRDTEVKPLEKKKREGLRIEDVRSRDVGEDNLPAEPPVNEFKIEL